MIFTIPAAWALTRRRSRLDADIYLGTMAIVVVGSVLWGLRLGDFNTFYVFFGGIAVFATPLAAAAAWSVFCRSRQTNHLRVAAFVVVLCAVQLLVGAAIIAPAALRKSAPLPERQPIPIAMLDEICSTSGRRQGRIRVSTVRGGDIRPASTAQHRRSRRPTRRAHVLPGRRCQPACRRHPVGGDTKLIVARHPSAPSIQMCSRARPPRPSVPSFATTSTTYMSTCSIRTCCCRTPGSSRRLTAPSCSSTPRFRPLMALETYFDLVEVDPLPLDDQRALADLRVDRADVLAEHADEEQLDGAEEVDADQEGREPELQRRPRTAAWPPGIRTRSAG